MGDQNALDARERRLLEVTYRTGLSISFLMMVGGLVLRWLTGEDTIGVGQGLLGGASASGVLMRAGIGVLAATPAVNVALLLFLWARTRKVRLALTAATVLLTLMLAVFLGVR